MKKPFLCLGVGSLDPLGYIYGVIKEKVMYYLIGFGIGLVLSVLLLIPSMNEFGEVSLYQLKKSYGKVLSCIGLGRIFTK